MSKRTIYSFFKKQVNDHDRETDTQTDEPIADTNVGSSNVEIEQPPPKSRRIEIAGFDVNNLECDPGLRRPIDDYPVNERDVVRKSYIRFGPNQPKEDYKFSGPIKHRRRFQYHWFKSFPWLEYSSTTHRAYCFPCYLFSKKPIGRPRSDVFAVKGLENWAKVMNGKDCALLKHMGKDSNSAHNFVVRCWNNLSNQSCHIEKLIEKQTDEQIRINRLLVKTSIDTVRWLTFQACAFRGHNEKPDSNNQGNFLELMKLLRSYNEQVDVAILGAPKNAKYTSPLIQKEILQVFARRVQRSIREEIGSAKFCLLVDESRDIAKREQMAIVLRFVDKGGCIRERFMDLVHVKETSSLTLKNEICVVLSRHNLNIKDLRGQGYDGASNMRGEWNGLQALFLKECQYAYYVHCLAHQLQLTLVSAAREVQEVHTFFQNLVSIINIVIGSSKRHDQFQASQIVELRHLIDTGELDTGTGANQIGTLQRPGDTRWSSYFKSVCSLTRLYGPTCSILADIAEGGTSFSQRGDATHALKILMSFEFVFILHMIKEIMGITDGLCQSWQQKSQDIVNAMHLLRTTKQLIQKLREEGWETLLENVNSFCERHGISVVEMDATYVDVLRSLRKQGQRKHTSTMEHHFRVEIFTATIDQQLQELNSRFSEQTIELLILSASLSPKDGYRSFKTDDICSLAEKYYPEDFSEHEKTLLRYKLQHYELDVPKHPDLKNLSNIVDLCTGLTTTGKADRYPLVDRLLRLVMTLPVSTATTERSFSAMKIIKTCLRNKMEDELLRDYMIVYIEKEIARTFEIDTIIDEFDDVKGRKIRLK